MTRSLILGHHGRNVQDAIFVCDTPDADKAKYRELLDILLKQNGVYIGSKEKRKVKASRGKSGDIVVPSVSLRISHNSRL